MNARADGLVNKLLSLPIFRAEWVLWLLLALSVISVAAIFERWLFYRRRRIDVNALQKAFARQLREGNLHAAAELLGARDALETNVALIGLRAYDQGPESVEELLSGALGSEKARYEKRLGLLATLASNCPYIGLFGTVLGIVRAFNDLSRDMSSVGGGVMAGIAEALVTTAVGLFVAIPAVVAFNAFKGTVKQAVTDSESLCRELLAALKSAAAPDTQERLALNAINQKMIEDSHANS
jgi:biopolymer transport protein ExbB/TolQ